MYNTNKKPNNLSTNNNRIFYIYKKIGKTPLQAIEEFKIKNPSYKNSKLSYAGRLDPMAEGDLLILAGDENKKRHIYEKMDKKYEFSVLFGFSTDSYDLLGIPKIGKLKILSNNDIEKIKTFINSRTTTFNQEYPPYSSRTVSGKPLFYYAKNNLLDEIKIPSKKVTIYSYKLLNVRNLILGELIKEKISTIRSIKGDFRQHEIIQAWKSIYKSNSQNSLTVIDFEVMCSYGLYVRNLASELGKIIGNNSMCIKIKKSAGAD